MGKLITPGRALSLLTLAAALLPQPAARAQAASNFDTARAVTAPAADDRKAAPTVTKDAVLASTTPSRQVGGADLASYMESLSSVFMSRGRTLDPFGQSQDPDAKPIVKAPEPGKLKRAAPILATPFSDIVKMMVVTTIMPGEKRFLIGTRSIQQGDQIPLTFRGKLIRVQVTEVTSRQIAFRNLDSGETATRQLDLLPAGMTPGHGGITAPGMVPDSPNAPIELGTGDPTP